MNSKIRKRGLSAREMLTQRDQFTNTQMPISDRELITKQYEAKLSNHHYSEVSKAPKGKMHIADNTIQNGDLVYLYSDRNKCRARDRYLVVSIVDNTWCYLKKFVGNQFRNASYKVKLSDCYKVPHVPDSPLIQRSHESDDEFLINLQSTEKSHLEYENAPPMLPATPPAISGNDDIVDEPQDSEQVPIQPINDDMAVPSAGSIPMENEECNVNVPSPMNQPNPSRPTRNRTRPGRFRDLQLY